MNKATIVLEDGWAVMEMGIKKLERILEDLPESPFNSASYVEQYTTIYNMCTQKAAHNYSQQLYTNDKQTFVDYLRKTVYIDNSAEDTNGGRVKRRRKPSENVLDMQAEMVKKPVKKAKCSGKAFKSKNKSADEENDVHMDLDEVSDDY